MRFRHPSRLISIARHGAMGLAMLVWQSHAQATCQVYAGGGQVEASIYTVSFSALPTFDPTVPDGTVLARAESPMGTMQGHVGTWIGRCTPNFVGTFLYSGIGALDSRFNTYPTGIAGIGARVGTTTNAGMRWWTNFLEPHSGVSSVSFMPDYSFVIELVKTGRITAPGTLSGEVGRVTLVDHGGQVPISVRLSGSVAVRPLVPSCVVNTKKIAVPMGSAAIATLNHDGVGPGRDFAINLQCTGGTQGATTRMFITLTDATNAGNRGNVLGLTPNSTAKGVGVRIMNQSTPVSFGPDSSAASTPNQWFVTETGNRGVDIPLTAHYVRTGNVTPGTADAIATFTMSYQ